MNQGDVPNRRIAAADDGSPETERVPTGGIAGNRNIDDTSTAPANTFTTLTSPCFAASIQMQFQGNDGSRSRISIPNHVVQRRPSSDGGSSVRQLGEVGSTEDGRHRQQQSDSRPTNAATAAKGGARASPTSTTHPSTETESQPDIKRMKLGDESELSSTTTLASASPTTSMSSSNSAVVTTATAEAFSAASSVSDNMVTATTTAAAAVPSLPLSSSSLSSSWRIDGTKPKRPMTAYNFFFREQRNRIKAMGLEAYKSMMEGGDARNDSSSLSSSSSSIGGPTASSATSANIKDNCTKNPPLHVMAKTIAHYWKRVSSVDLDRYQELARREQKRYRSEMKEYRAMLRDQQGKREQISAAGGLVGVDGGANLTGVPATAAGGTSSSSWTPEQMTSIFGYLNQAQMEQAAPHGQRGSTSTGQEQQLIMNAQNAMIGQLQRQIRTLQQHAHQQGNVDGMVSAPQTNTPSTSTAGKPPSTCRGMLNRLEAQASIMRLQIERGKAMDLGELNHTGQLTQQHQQMTTISEGGMVGASFSPHNSMQANLSTSSGAGNFDQGLGTVSGVAADPLLASTALPGNCDVYTQAPMSLAQHPLPTSSLDQGQHYSQPAPLSSHPPPPQPWPCGNPLPTFLSAPIGTLQEQPTHLATGITQQQQQQMLSAESSSFGAPAGSIRQYQTQRSSLSALSVRSSPLVEADDEGNSSGDNSTGTMDAFSIAQMLFGPTSNT